jgi:SH3-like domain-containing protein
MRAGLMLALAMSMSIAAVTGVAAQDGGVSIGGSGLEVPRFVSLKASRVNVRVGPGEDYPIAWVFTRPGLPIEVIQEYDTWRRVRDSDGSVGWVFQGLLSGERTAAVAPWSGGDIKPLRAGPSGESAIAAYLETGVVGAVSACRAGWCKLTGEGFSGWIEQDQLWGVYLNEDID